MKESNDSSDVEDDEEAKKGEGEEEFKEQVFYYRGTCYPQRGIFEGTWGTTPDEEKGTCSFKTISTYDAKVKLIYTKDNSEVEDTMQMDMNTLKFTTKRGTDKGINLSTIEHLDNCQIAYLLTHKDAAFVRHGEEAYVQAKMISSPDDDTGGNGDGYVDTKLQLYRVSEARKKGPNVKKKIEPESQEIQFLLNQSFLSTQEK